MSKSQPRRDVTKWLGALAIFVLSGVVFAPAIRCDFVNFDDDRYVYANPLVSRGLTVSGFARAFTQAHVRNWHPLTTISHMVDCQLFRLNPAGHHAVNVGLHALAAAGLLLVLQAMTGEFWRAFFIAAIFAVHPLRLESVVWISERKDVLSALFFVLTLGAYVRYARTAEWRRFIPVILLFAAGLMAKPMLVTLPLILLLLDYWPLSRLADTEGAGFYRVNNRRAIGEKLPLLALSALSGAATILAARRFEDALGTVPVMDRVTNPVLSYCVYVYQLFWPAPLSVFYPVATTPPPLFILIGAVTAVFGVTIVVIALRRRCPYMFVGWFWYLVMLLPVSGILPIGLQAHADRYTYLPHIGLLIAIVWGAADVLRKRTVQTVAVPAGAVAIALLGWRSWEGLHWWRNSESLWTHSLAVTKNNDVALNNLAAVYEARGELSLAMEKYRQAQEILERRPLERSRLSLALVHNNLGNIEVREGDISLAMDEYRQSIALQPNLASAHVNLGQTYATLGNWNSAFAEFESASRLQPQDADVQHRAGAALMHLGRVDDAIAFYRSALKADPDFALAEVDLGNALLEKKQIEDALTHYRRATQIEPQNASAHFNLASVFLRQRRIRDAIQEFEQVVKLQPRDPEGHLNLANALAAASQDKRAVAEIETALQLVPNSVSALNNLAWLLAASADSSVRNPGRAVSLAEKAVSLAPRPHPLIYHTLAAAYAAAGRKDEAITAAERSKQLAEENGDTDLATTVQRELDSYRSSSAH